MFIRVTCSRPAARRAAAHRFSVVWVRGGFRFQADADMALGMQRAMFASRLTVARFMDVSFQRLALSMISCVEAPTQSPGTPEQIQLSCCYQYMHISLAPLGCDFFPLLLPQTQTSVMFVAPGAPASNLPRVLSPRPPRNDAVSLRLCHPAQQNAGIHR